MVKPYSYVKDLILSDFAGKLFYFILFLPILTVFCLITYHTFNIEFPVFSFSSVATFIILLGTTYSIQLALAIIITLMTFWFEGANGLEHFKWLAFTMLSGLLLPPQFMPGWLKTLTDYSPLKYTYVIPIQVLQGSYQLIFTDWLIIGSTILVLWFLVFYTWHRAVKVYISAGG
jgi:ABC-type uncharacterized transport system permease subunit